LTASIRLPYRTFERRRWFVVAHTWGVEVGARVEVAGAAP
jgi:hypothetical protein